MNNILSLFDGISCCRVALDRVGITYNNYYASEIDKYAITVAQKNYPSTIQLGDINNWKSWDIDWSSIDLLAGGSPCFVAGTLVMTDNGFKNIEEVIVNDLVLTHTSKYQKVLRCGCKKIDKLYIIKGMGFDKIETTENHPFYVRKLIRKWNNKKRTYERFFDTPSWVKAKDLDKSYYLCSTYNNTAISNDKDCAFWEFVGRFTADGWIVKTKRKNRNNSYIYKIILCCGKDELIACKDLLDKLNYNYNVIEERTAYKFCISDMKLLKYLEEIKRGALNKIVHPDVWKLPIFLKKSYLKGYIDGDGSFSNGKYKITSISKNLIYGIKLLIMEVYNRPVSLYFNKRKPFHAIEGRLVNQHNTYQIEFKMTTGKQDKAFFDSGYIWSPITKIFVDNKNSIVYNLEVENDNSYTANSIVVHNCQGFSFAGKQLNFDDPRSKLFFVFVDILNHIKIHNPNVKFLLENVVMKKEYQEVITKALGVEPVLINSSLVSAQSRKRLYWTNIENIQQPEDKTILLDDILQPEEDIDDKYYIKNIKEINWVLNETRLKKKYTAINPEKSLPEMARQYVNWNGTYYAEPVRLLNIGNGGQGERVYYVNAKSPTLSSLGGGRGAKTGLYLVAQRGRNIIDGKRNDYSGALTVQRLETRIDGKTNTLTTVQKDNYVLLEINGEYYRIRKLTPIECERLQTLPDNYTNVVSDSQRYKQLGNGWTVDVIVHIFRNIV